MNIFAKLEAGVTTSSAAATRSLARELALALPADCTLALHGNLGVGKTTFVQGLAEGFGIHEPVTSPTFNIFTLHRGTKRTLIHLDAYRLESSRQIDDLMVEDFLTSPYCMAIEWPEKISDWIPQNTHHLVLSILGPAQHRVILENVARTLPAGD